MISTTDGEHSKLPSSFQFSSVQFGLSAMDRLAQFVSKSFESNNNRVSSPGQCLNLTNTDRGKTPPRDRDTTSRDVPREIPSARDGLPQKDHDNIHQDIQEPSEVTKTNEEPQETKPAAKNWLISSDSPKRQPTLITSFGMDLRVNGGNPTVLYDPSVVLTDPSLVIRNGTEISNALLRSDSDDADKKHWMDNVNIKSPVASPKNNSRCSSSSPAIELEDSAESGTETAVSCTRSVENRGRTPSGSEDEKKPCKGLLFSITTV